jgi:RHS repeat-associated protein
VNVTRVKAAHITELRTAVNAVRSLAGLAAAQWTNQTLTATVTVISADDVRDLRTKLDEALTALGIQTSNYDDQTLAGAPNGTVIKKIHITQLRQRATSGTGGSGGSSPNQFGAQWLVTDQLGTPRMMFDQTGSLANVKRSDYLPFGEDLVAGGRSTTPGYGASDGVRQKFTGYERDGESALDYAHARYYASKQGRFTGVDPMSGNAGDPQSWNRYAYVSNNPVNLTDPTGMNYFIGGGTVDPGGPREYRIDGFDMGPEGTASQLTSETMVGLYAQAADRYWYPGGDRLAKPKETEISVYSIELLEKWNENSKPIGKGTIDKAIGHSGQDDYTLDMHSGDNDPNGISTIVITFSASSNITWDKDYVRASANSNGRWKLVETPTGEPPIRKAWPDATTAKVYINVRLRDVKAINTPIKISVGGNYTSYYRHDQRVGTEAADITRTINLRLLISEAPLTTKPLAPIP